MEQSQPWAKDIYAALEEAQVRQVPFVPDGGHVDLIRLVHQSPTMRAVTLTTEEEGVAQCAGAWLGGARSALLMQSSGVGNCINMLSLIKTCRFPFLTLVTMRGEWGEFNSWQVPMGEMTEPGLGAMGVRCVRVDAAHEVGDTVCAAAHMTYEGGAAVAVLLSQRLIGAKDFSQ